MHVDPSDPSLLLTGPMWGKLNFFACGWSCGLTPVCPQVKVIEIIFRCSRTTTIFLFSFYPRCTVPLTTGLKLLQGEVLKHKFHTRINHVAARMAKTLWRFGCSVCNKINGRIPKEHASVLSWQCLSSCFLTITITTHMKPWGMFQMSSCIVLHL